MKEDILGSPTNRPKALEGEPFHSAQNSNGSIYGSRKPLDSVTPFGQRKSKFVVQFTLNEPSVTDNRKIENDDQDNGDDDDVIKRVQPVKRCSLQINGSQPEPGCRFMYDRIEDKVL